jgi:hypothetical protein
MLQASFRESDRKLCFRHLLIAASIDLVDLWPWSVAGIHLAAVYLLEEALGFLEMSLCHRLRCYLCRILDIQKLAFLLLSGRSQLDSQCTLGRMYGRRKLVCVEYLSWS